MCPTLAGYGAANLDAGDLAGANFSDDELRANSCCMSWGTPGAATWRRNGFFCARRNACIGSNPLVWMAGRAARLDRELACDAWVLSRDLPSPAYGRRC